MVSKIICVFFVENSTRGGSAFLEVFVRISEKRKPNVLTLLVVTAEVGQVWTTFLEIYKRKHIMTYMTHFLLEWSNQCTCSDYSH